MELYLASKKPQMCEGHPDWWHCHGMKMQTDKDSSRDWVIIKNRVAKLEIFQAVSTQPIWPLKWQIIQCSLQEEVMGKIRMDTHTLKSAFDFENITPRGSRWLIEKYGGGAAEQGAFIRWGNFLNIPGPGTGHDGDPNISIFLTDVIRNSIFNLIYSNLFPEEKRHWTAREACKEYFGDEGVIRPTNITDDYPL
ncbi:MAG: hypothetical protein Q7R43_05200 [Candidatus Daviesbacteria bacterium]|nr:hypothetical protein [Candidatus Daviesbacteria bacterium]